MRICFITNLSTERCGVRAFGDEWIAAVRRAGHTVDVWDGTYSNVVRAGYLPYHTIGSYDVVHLNWDPQAINHYLPRHFAEIKPPLSLFLHDVPPNSTCPVYDVAQWRFAHEAGEGIKVLPHAVPHYVPTTQDLSPENPPLIGVTGIRNDPGFEKIKQLCAKRGWAISVPSWWDGGKWLSTEEEIARLAKCTVNICWYHTTGRGKSMAAMFCCAARRPLICSASSMFSSLWPFEDEVYFAQVPGDEMDMTLYQKVWEAELEPLVDEVLADIANEEELVPDLVCQFLGWDDVIKPVLTAWSGR